MVEQGATTPPQAVSSDKIRTVGELKAWLTGLPDHHSVWGAIQGRQLIGEVWCRHAEGRVIIEVPRVEQG